MGYKSCEIERCHRVHSCRGLCRHHYDKWYKGLIKKDGTPIGDYKPLPNICRFPECTKTRKDFLRKGLCNKHRKWAEKGIIDKDTCEILLPDRIPVKKSLDYVRVEEKLHIFKCKCRVDGCLKEARRNNFCNGHSSSFRDGYIDSDGNIKEGRRASKNKEKSCKVNNCKRITKRYVRGFCLYHYDCYRKGKLNYKGLTTIRNLFKTIYNKKENTKEVNDV